ncbi:MAG: outer membrane protein transport protein [Pseudomonadota bacterium]
MSKRYFKFVMVMTLALAVTTPAWATNGTNLIGIGPTSRAMGGVGVAAPQDAVSAIFANPAGMCFGSYCPGSEAEFGGTFFAPTVKSTVKTPFGAASEDSQMKPFVVPAVGIAAPVNPKLRFGIGAYGVSGMGVDYKGKSPAVYGNLYTKLEIMKFAPNLAYQVSDNFSVGASLSVDYQNLDLGEGSAHDYAYGAQLGLIYKIGIFSLGASYTTPQGVTHKNVSSFGSGTPANNVVYPTKRYFDLELQSPPIYAGGVAFQPNDKLLVEFDIKYLPWADASGYKDFDWDNQWVYALGAQYRVTPAVALRAGYNYSKNPVKEHNGFNAGGATNLQGTSVPNFMYEQFRIIGFPAVVEQHATLGLGWNVTESFIIDLSLMHAFKQSISESDSSGTWSFESSLEETSTSFGCTWRF